MKRLLVAMILVAGLFTAGVSSAGLKIDDPVYVSSSSMYAGGALGTARNSSDVSEWIGCEIEGYGGNEVLACYAQTSNGTYGSCSTQSPQLIAAAQALSSDSDLYFSWNSSGTCTALLVNEASYSPPKQP